MEELDMFTALHLRNSKEKNQIKYRDSILEMQDVIDGSFKDGFLEGYNIGKTDERFDVKVKI